MMVNNFRYILPGLLIISLSLYITANDDNNVRKLGKTGSPTRSVSPKIINKNDKIKKSTKSSKKLKNENQKKKGKKSNTKNPDKNESNVSSGELINQPHKIEYEKRMLCLPGLNQYGCADKANIEKGGNHYHEVIDSKRYVKHVGAYVAKSFCDIFDEIIEGSPPDVTSTNLSGGISGRNYSIQAHPRRQQECARRMTSSSVMAGEHLKFKGVVIENGIRYNKFVATTADMSTTKEHMKHLHLTQTGLAPDRIEYFEDEDGVPHAVRKYTGQVLFHETKIIKFATLTAEDKQTSMEGIVRSITKDRLRRKLNSQSYSGRQMSIRKERNVINKTKGLHPARRLQLDNSPGVNLAIPENCDTDDFICLKIKESIKIDLSSSYALSFNLKAGGKSVSLEAGYSLGNDLSLQKANASAKGCLDNGIKVSHFGLGIKVCLKGAFDYKKGGDNPSPSTQTYSVEMSFTADAQIFGVEGNLGIEGKLSMKVQSVKDEAYFIGYDGIVEARVDVGIFGAGLGIGVNYETPSYLDINKQDGWATKFYGQLDWNVDIWFFSDHGKFTHVFSCEPSDNEICSGAGNPNLPPPPPDSTLFKGNRLNINDSLKSPNGDYALVMQGDGNLVLYGPDRKVEWEAKSYDMKCTHARFQEDGNFVVYTDAGEVGWSYSTDPQSNVAYVTMQDDGNLVIYDTDGRPIWASFDHKD